MGTFREHGNVIWDVGFHMLFSRVVKKTGSEGFDGRANALFSIYIFLRGDGDQSQKWCMEKSMDFSCSGKGW